MVHFLIVENVTFLGLFFYRALIQKISSVSLDDLEKIGSQYFAPLFDPVNSKVAICCHPTKVQEIVKDFKEYVLLCLTEHFVY